MTYLLVFVLQLLYAHIANTCFEPAVLDAQARRIRLSGDPTK